MPSGLPSGRAVRPPPEGWAERREQGGGKRSLSRNSAPSPRTWALMRAGRRGPPPASLTRQADASHAPRRARGAVPQRAPAQRPRPRGAPKAPPRRTRSACSARPRPREAPPPPRTPGARPWPRAAAAGPGARPGGSSPRAPGRGRDRDPPPRTLAPSHSSLAPRGGSARGRPAGCQRRSAARASSAPRPPRPTACRPAAPPRRTPGRASPVLPHAAPSSARTGAPVGRTQAPASR
mmetsp:Transcript_19284/g.57929  ORF Transcript_19284/g.57929 Transcript_19284/m.57929 type:complete len:236 (+) Transcript_19284:95-802(+)